jgi:DNA-binding protein H-NS
MITPQPITSMATYKDLVAQRDALEAQIESARKAELSGAVSKVQELVAEFGLTAQDVFGGKSARAGKKSTGSKVAAKYRDPSTGVTWTGRGKPPRWIADQDRGKFAI